MHDGKVKYLADIHHVPSITKNLVSIGQMFEKNLQVKINPTGLFIEECKEEGHLIPQGKKVGRMFTLDVDIPKLKAFMFA